MGGEQGIGTAAFGRKQFPLTIKRFCLPCIYFSGYLLFLMASNPGLFICGSDLEFPFKTNSFNWGKHIYLKNNIQLIKLQE